MIRRAALVSVLLCACAAPARLATRPVTSSSAPPPVSLVSSSNPPPRDAGSSSSSAPPGDTVSAPPEPASLPLPACNADGFGFAVESPYDIPCDDLMHCRGTPHFRVRNCRDAGALEVHLRIGPPGNAPRALIDFAPIEPGHDAISQLYVGHAETFAISAHFTTRDGLDAALITSLTVTASVRDRAIAACDACHGEWGRHGVMQIESCICRTRDAGHECEDPRDCEGECIAAGHRIVRRGHPPRRLPNGMVSVSETLAVAVGRCSEFRGVFGCHAVIPEGSRDRGPQPLHSLPRGMICRD